MLWSYIFPSIAEVGGTRTHLLATAVTRAMVAHTLAKHITFKARFIILYAIYHNYLMANFGLPIRPNFDHCNLVSILNL